MFVSTANDAIVTASDSLLVNNKTSKLKAASPTVKAFPEHHHFMDPMTVGGIGLLSGIAVTVFIVGTFLYLTKWRTFPATYHYSRDSELLDDATLHI